MELQQIENRRQQMSLKTVTRSSPQSSGGGGNGNDGIQSLNSSSSLSRLSSFGISSTNVTAVITIDRFGFEQRGRDGNACFSHVGGGGGGGGGGAVARVKRHKIERAASKRRRRRADRDNRRLLKWTSMLCDWRSTVLTSPKMVDRRVRKGVPMPLRADVWCKMSGAQALANDPLRRHAYDLLQKTPSSSVPWEREILQVSLRIYHGR